MKIANINKAYLGNNIINRIGDSFVYMGDGVAPSVCPVVIPSITGYEGGEMEVYSLDDEKWYEMNNLGQYEEYGIMPTVNDISTVTTYKGKLVIYNQHEYEYDGTQWVDLGNAGTSRLIDSPSYIYNDSSHQFSIPLNYTGSTDSKWQIRFKPTQNGGATIMGDTSSSDDDDYRIFWNGGRAYFDIVNQRINSYNAVNVDKNFEYGNYYIKDLNSGTNVVTGTPLTYQRTTTLRLGLASASSGSGDYFQLSGLTMYHGEEKSREFIPAIDNGEICIFDKVSGEFFKSDNNQYPLSGGTIQQVEVGTVVPVKEYEEKETIETEVTVLSLDDIQCPFEGMIAHVGGNTYTYVNGQWVLDNSVSGHNNTTNNLTIKVNKISGNSSSGQYVVIPVSSDTSFNQSLSAYTLTSIKDIFRGTTVKDAVMRISSPVTDIGTMFYSATSLVSVDVSLLNTRSARSMGGAFANCYNLTSITGLNNWVTSSFWDFSGVFLNASGLTSLDLSNWEASGVTTMEQMFDGCKGLVTLNLSNWNMQSVTNNNNMFRNCNALTDIIANSTSQSTLERIENRLVSDNKTSVRITRDGYYITYVNGQWVETDDN